MHLSKYDRQIHKLKRKEDKKGKETEKDVISGCVIRCGKVYHKIWLGGEVQWVHRTQVKASNCVAEQENFEFVVYSCFHLISIFHCFQLSRDLTGPEN